MSALPVAMTLSGVSVTIPANVLFATATISCSTLATATPAVRINGVLFGTTSSTSTSAQTGISASSLQGIGVKGGDTILGPSGELVAVNLIAYTS